MQIQKSKLVEDAEAIADMRDADLLSQTDIDRKMDGNVDGNSEQSLNRGTFYKTQMTSFVPQEIGNINRNSAIITETEQASNPSETRKFNQSPSVPTQSVEPNATTQKASLDTLANILLDS
jgi:hypothetical protein